MLEFIFLFSFLFASLLVTIEIGYRLGNKGRTEESGRFQSSATIDGFVMTLLSLLLAFGFNAARDDFNKRNELIFSEAHAIRSTQLVFNGLDDGMREPCLNLLSRYVQSRQEYSKVLTYPAKAKAKYEEGRDVIASINQVLRARDGDGRLRDEAREALRSVGELDEHAIERHIMVTYRRPWIVITLLIGFSLLAGLLLGTGLDLPRRAQRWHRLVFAFVTAAVISVILDYSNPRAGVIRVDASDQVLRDLQS